MESIIGVLEGRDGAEKVEVWLDPEEGETGQVYLRLVSWGEGIGWYPQKTIELDCRQLGALHTILKRGEALCETQKRRVPRSVGKILPFHLSRWRQNRVCKGEGTVQETGSW